MSALFNITRKIWQDHRGQDLAEYALFSAFLAFASAATLPVIASSLSAVLVKVTGCLATTSLSNLPG
jgi:Flp pilus assembly pilin Flp